MIASIAVATGTLPSRWRHEDAADILTVVQILDDQAHEAKRAAAQD